MVLFLDRVYGIEDQNFLLHLLEVGFLPDLRAAASLDTVRVCVCVCVYVVNSCESLIHVVSSSFSQLFLFLSIFWPFMTLLIVQL